MRYCLWNRYNAKIYLYIIFGFIISATILNSCLTIVRHKRFVWLTKERKLIFPPGSSLIVTPKLQIPFLRQPPEGINSDIQVSWPFYLFFDGLGMTSGDHPWPPFFPFSDMFYNSSFIAQYFPNLRPRPKNKVEKPSKRRSQRSVLSLPPPENFPGGERAILLPKLETACLLRVICEVHEYPLGLYGYGLFGEFLTLFFSISESDYAESHLPGYLKAELIGREGEDCSTYYEACPSSIFTWVDKKRNFGFTSSETEEIANSKINVK